MADGYVSMLQADGMGLIMVIRAAVIPSSAQRTALVTAMFALPMLLVTALLVPAAGGGLTWRASDSAALPWLPATAAMMWSLTILTCSVISRVIYGLRAEVREARRLGQYVIEKNRTSTSRCCGRAMCTRSLWTQGTASVAPLRSQTSGHV
jgi:hypothetical protein